MTNKELFKQAIAEAKTIREAALVNAKAALEETLTPHLQSMLASKLEEMAKDEDEEPIAETQDADANENGEKIEEEISLDEEFNLDEFLAELELEEGSEDEINEAKEDEESEEETEEEPTEDEESKEGESEETSVADLSIEDLKDIIKDIVDSELEAEEAETEEDENAEEIDINDAGNGDDSMGMDGAGSEDEINLEELLAELDALDEEKSEEDENMQYEAKKAKKDEKELDEAIATIETLRTELNEVNLLNAKLLYVNKIFKAKNLSEDNKIKVINAFDKATTPNEAKLVFEALNESLEAKESSKGMVKEGIIKGFASKPAGNAPSKQIVEINEHMARMQKLAGITKY
jgi:hypothetical protein